MSISTSDRETSWARSARALLTATIAILALALWSAPALAAAPEAPLTEAATGVSAGEATLNGQLNPGAGSEALKYHFAYSAGSECAESGLVTPESPAEAEGNHKNVSAPATGLEPNREYAFCLVAANPAEEAELTIGNSVTFKTSAPPPTLASESASGVTPFEARIEALVNANNQATECHVQYGEATVSENELPCEQPILEGFGEQGVGLTLTGLQPATTYHYRVVVENAALESVDGTEEEFTTLSPEKPALDGESVSGVTSKKATLEAQINPNFQETTYSFKYATNETLSGARTVSGAAPIPAGFGDQLASVELGQVLAPGTTYFYRVLASNATGTSEGAIQSFTTIGLPLVSSGALQSVTRSTAQLAGGSVDPVGAVTTYSYRYIDQAGYQAGLLESPANPYAKGASSLPAVELPAGYTAQLASAATLAELQPNTTYHFALVATNALGTTIGADATFTTSPATPPAASTGAATAISNHSATVSGTVTPSGLETSYELQLATEPGSYLPVAFGTLEASSAATPVSFALSQLPAGATFHYRLVASNQDGTSYGADQSFTTVGFPAPAAPVLRELGLLSAPPLVAIPAGQPVNKPPKPLSRAQKLAKALKACQKKPKRHRAACKREARRRYAPKKGSRAEKKL